LISSLLKPHVSGPFTYIPTPLKLKVLSFWLLFLGGIIALGFVCATFVVGGDRWYF
jgi:hypothetical protein